MPKTPIDYSKTVIYKICCKDIKIVDCYVGSTNDFDRRKGEHKRHCHNENHEKYNFPVYQFIRSHGGWDNWSMIPVEIFNTCTNKLEKLARERYYVELLNATLNGNVPGIFYELGKKEYNKQYGAKYRDEHQAHIKAKDKKRLEIKFKCQCGGQYCDISKSRHFRSQLHVNYIKRVQLLADHNTTMTEIDNLIEITEEFIKRAEKFLAGQNLQVRRAHWNSLQI